MSDWYKMNPVDWNAGTDDLTLEQEAAYLRICNAIYITERPVRDNPFVIAGLLRCNERRARRLIGELIEAGKLILEDGYISNRRAVEEVSNRDQTRIKRKSAGSRGGIESGKSRAKALKSNNADQAIGSTPDEPEERREEEKREPPSPPSQKRFANPAIILQSVVDSMAAQSFVQHLEEKRRPLTSQSAEILVETLREVQGLGGNPTEALRLAVKKGWISLDVEYLRNAGFPLKTPPPSAAIDWPARLDVFNTSQTWAHAWGPKPGEPGCKVPAALLREIAA